jgi:FdhD protein
MSGDTPTRKTERGSVARRNVQRGPESGAVGDDIAVEEPLEIRVAADTLATIMRTPGEDNFLATGFLHGEGIIGELADLGRVFHCGRPTDEGYGNLIDVAAAPGTALAPELTSLSRRGTIVSSSCGVCGRERIDDLTSRLGKITRAVEVSESRVTQSIEQLSAGQTGFARTGGLHGALVLGADGQVLALSEDVGRHNAVDKVIGKLLYAEQLTKARCDGDVLTVSGRTSFEIVQKAAAARIPIVVSVSAPTSLAIDLAEALGITLIGFARAGGFNVYTHAQRVRWH